MDVREAMTPTLKIPANGATPLPAPSAHRHHATAEGDGDEAWFVLVDPRPLRRAGVMNLLESWVGLCRQVAAHTIDELERLRDEEGAAPSLIILSVGGVSVHTPEIHGDVERLRRGFAGVPLAILSDREEIGEARAALEAGAGGFIATTIEPRLMREALRLVRSGGIFVPPRLMDQLLGRGQPNDGARPMANGAEALEPPVPVASGLAVDGLTPRQTHVLELLCEGLPNKLIAARLGMTESTVKVHVRQIMKRLGATNRTEAAILAQRHDPPPAAAE